MVSPFAGRTRSHPGPYLSVACLQRSHPRIALVSWGVVVACVSVSVPPRSNNRPRTHHRSTLPEAVACGKDALDDHPRDDVHGTGQE